MSDELIKEEKKRTIKLGGQDYELSSFNLNILSGIEQEFGCGLDKLSNQFQKTPAVTLRGLTWIFLRDKYPKLTKEQIGQLIEVKDIGVISDILTAILTED